MARRKKLETLEDIFANDPMEAVSKKIDAVWEEVKHAHPQEAAAQEKVSETLRTIYDEPGKPEVGKRLIELDAWGEDWRKNKDEIAGLLGASVSELEDYNKLRIVIGRAIKKRVIGPHKTLWKRLVKNAPITVLERGNFPSDANRPLIVFYSADWCGPCQMIKPAFARLAHFFDKGKLYFYSSDTIFEEHPELKFIPQLVAYLPNGARVSSRCGGDVKELWQNMNLLITLGQGFEGTGELVCSDTECRIEPKREA